MKFVQEPARVWSCLGQHNQLDRENFDEYDAHKGRSGIADLPSVTLNKRLSDNCELEGSGGTSRVKVTLDAEDLVEIVRILVNRNWLRVRVRFEEGDIYGKRHGDTFHELDAVECCPDGMWFMDSCGDPEMDCAYEFDDMNCLALRSTAYTAHSRYEYKKPVQEYTVVPKKKEEAKKPATKKVTRKKVTKKPAKKVTAKK